jgi:hypothetical protein
MMASVKGNNFIYRPGREEADRVFTAPTRWRHREVPMADQPWGDPGARIGRRALMVNTVRRNRARNAQPGTAASDRLRRHLS